MTLRYLPRFTVGAFGFSYVRPNNSLVREQFPVDIRGDTEMHENVREELLGPPRQIFKETDEDSLTAKDFGPLVQNRHIVATSPRRRTREVCIELLITHILHAPVRLRNKIHRRL